MKITKDQLKGWKACRSGIFAGLRLRIADWSLYARVIAKAKPNNLVSGAWVEPAAEAEKEAA